MRLCTDIGKDRLDNAQPSGVNLLALFGIDLCLHLIDQVRRQRIHLDGKVSARCDGFAQTARLERAGMVDIIGSIAVDLVAGMAGQFFTRWTEIDVFCCIKTIY